MKNQVAANDKERSTRKLLHHMSFLLATMPQNELNKLVVPACVVSTKKIPCLSYIPSIKHEDLVAKDLSCFKFCKELYENKKFKKELNKPREAGEFLLVAFIIEDNRVFHEWNVMQLKQNDDGNLMNHTVDPRPPPAKQKGKEKEKGQTFANILKQMENQKETKTNLFGIEVVVNGILPEDLIIPDSTKQEAYAKLRIECRKVVQSTTQFLQKQEDDNGKLPIPQEELSCISKDMAGLFHQRATNEIFGGNETAFCAAIALSSSRKKSQKILNKPIRSCATCGTMSPFHMKCGACGNVWYCSVDCQREDWVQGGHKKICINL